MAVSFVAFHRIRTSEFLSPYLLQRVADLAIIFLFFVNLMGTRFRKFCFISRGLRAGNVSWIRIVIVDSDFDVTNFRFRLEQVAVLCKTDNVRCWCNGSSLSSSLIGDYYHRHEY